MGSYKNNPPDAASKLHLWNPVTDNIYLTPWYQVALIMGICLHILCHYDKIVLSTVAFWNVSQLFICVEIVFSVIICKINSQETLLIYLKTQTENIFLFLQQCPESKHSIPARLWRFRPLPLPCRHRLWYSLPMQLSLQSTQVKDTTGQDWVPGYMYARGY